MTFFTRSNDINSKNTVLFTRRDAINSRDAALKERANIQSMLNQMNFSLEDVLRWFKYEIQSNPNKERYQYELYTWDTIESGTLPESVQKEFQEALAKKYLPSFPDCEITHYKKDNLSLIHI